MVAENGIIREELEDKIREREQRKSQVNIEEAKKREQRVIDNWNSLAVTYNPEQLSKEQTGVLTAARHFYEAIKKNLTMKNRYNIGMRRIGPYTGDFFPHTLKENKVAMAWILKVGDNQEELERLFPNQFNEKLLPREVIREPQRIIDGITINERGSYYPVLTVLAYLLLCESWGCDGLLAVKSSRPGALSSVGHISAETVLYNISITYTGEIDKPYIKIKVSPKAN